MRNIKGMDITEKRVCIVEGFLGKDGTITIEKVKTYIREDQ